jgi:hypothetical protein
MTDPAGIGDYGGIGILLQITGAPNTNDIILTPIAAQMIDTALDDGRPNTGSVTAEYASSSDCDEDAGNSYLTANTTIECIMYFELE